MEKKAKFEALLSNAGKAAKGMLDSTVHAVDQNDDGKFDMADVSAIAGVVGKGVKKGTQAMKETASEKARQLEMKMMQPIFLATLNETEFLMPKFIRITDRDKKYAESEVCQGAIGHGSDPKGMHLVNIFRDSIDSFGLTFYPDSDGEFYYVDPSDRDRYIALDEYFNYLKVARINELQKIAQDLGAKYFKVTYKEEKTSFTEKKASGNAKMPMTGKTEVHHESAEKSYSTIEVAAEMSCAGHEPIKPELKYMQRDPTIQTLVAMRMDEKAPLQHQKFTLHMVNSSGLKESDAVKIDTVLKGMKCTGNTTVESEAKNEARRYLEYEIEF